MIERSIRISDEIYKEIKALGKREKRTIKIIVEMAVTQYSKRRKWNQGI